MTSEDFYKAPLLDQILYDEDKKWFCFSCKKEAN